MSINRVKIVKYYFGNRNWHVRNYHVKLLFRFCFRATIKRKYGFAPLPIIPMLNILILLNWNSALLKKVPSLYLYSVAPQFVIIVAFWIDNTNKEFQLLPSWQEHTHTVLIKTYLYTHTHTHTPSNMAAIIVLFRRRHWWFLWLNQSAAAVNWPKSINSKTQYISQIIPNIQNTCN